MTARPMTARDIQRALLADRFRRSFVLPNYTPSNWYECDVFEVTKAGYFVEYEIKLSATDFKADANKRKSAWRWNDQTSRGETIDLGSKHQAIATADPQGPSRFFYVLPAHRADNDALVLDLQVNIPRWAGLVLAVPRPTYAPPRSVSLFFHTPAPTLHKLKFDQKRLEHARSVCYYRLHNLFCYGKS